jgi:hypothetical protein
MALPMTERGVPTLDRALDILDKWLFLAVFLLGTILIVALKALAVSQWVVTIAPVSLIVVYFGYVWFTPRFMVRDDHASDNLYYLGFLFTLVSLGMALYHFSADDGRSGSQLISNFGIALATTIVGLALRVGLMQMRQSPAEVERLARTELAKSAIELRKQLDASILEIELFRNKLMDRASDVIDTVVTKTTEALLQQVNAFETAVTQLLSGLQSGFGPVIDHGKQLRTASSRIVKGLSDVGDRLDGVEVPTDLVKARLEAGLTQLDESLGRYVETLNGLATRQTQLSDAVGGLASVVGGSESSLPALIGTLERLGPLVESAATSVIALGSATTRQADAVGKAVESTERSLEYLSDIVGGLSKSANDAGLALKHLEPVLERMNQIAMSSARQTELREVVFSPPQVARDAIVDGLTQGVIGVSEPDGGGQTLGAGDQPRLQRWRPWQR